MFGRNGAKPRSAGRATRVETGPRAPQEVSPAPATRLTIVEDMRPSAQK